MEKVKRERAPYRAQYIPLEDMFTKQELQDLKNAFDSTVCRNPSFQSPGAIL